jgi:hypothetical protein
MRIDPILVEFIGLKQDRAKMNGVYAKTPVSLAASPQDLFTARGNAKRKEEGIEWPGQL